MKKIILSIAACMLLIKANDESLPNQTLEISAMEDESPANTTENKVVICNDNQAQLTLFASTIQDDTMQHDDEEVAHRLYIENIKRYLQQTDADWKSLTPEQQDQKIMIYLEDDAIFMQMVELLKNEMADQEKMQQFQDLFALLHNKNHREQEGTILNYIVSFCAGQLQDDLVKFVLENGVSTDRLSGEFYGNKYYRNKTNVIDRAKHYIKDYAQEGKERLQQGMQTISEFLKDL